jgi:hypothetical protein
MTRMRRLTSCTILVGGLMLGCTPALDWREVRPEGSQLTALFPCKPESRSRLSSLGRSRVTMTMVTCSAAGLTFALGHAELGDPSGVTAALDEMRSALAANLGTGELRSAVFQVAGMTPDPRAGKIWIAGRLPDGTPVQEQAVLFARGTRVYQVALLGARLDEAAASVFFESLKLKP